jgi:hypothetical protein
VRVAKNLATRAERGEIGWAPYADSAVMPSRVGQGFSARSLMDLESA